MEHGEETPRKGTFFLRDFTGTGQMDWCGVRVGVLNCTRDDAMPWGSLWRSGSLMWQWAHFF
jgi:hypothetical protein